MRQYFCTSGRLYTVGSVPMDSGHIVFTQSSCRATSGVSTISLILQSSHTFPVTICWPHRVHPVHLTSRGISTSSLILKLLRFLLFKNTLATSCLPVRLPVAFPWHHSSWNHCKPLLLIWWTQPVHLWGQKWSFHSTTHLSSDQYLVQVFKAGWMGRKGSVS